MSVEGVGGKAAAVSFPIAPASPAALPEAQAPALKPARRRSVDRARGAALPPPYVVTPSALAVHAGIAVLLHTGRIAAFAPGGRKSFQAGSEVVAPDENAEPLAHDDPQRLAALRERISQAPQDELARLRKLAESVRDSGWGFAVEPTELPAPPGPQPATRQCLNPGDVNDALAQHGRIYLGRLTAVPMSPPARGSYQVVDAASAEPIISYEALRSFLRTHP